MQRCVQGEKSAGYRHAIGSAQQLTSALVAAVPALAQPRYEHPTSQTFQTEVPALSQGAARPYDCDGWPNDSLGAPRVRASGAGDRTPNA